MKKLIIGAFALFLTIGANAQHTNYEVRYATNPADFKSYATERIRKDFLVEKVFTADRIDLVYTMYDRFIIGGAEPVKGELSLDTIAPLKAPYFLERRELGIINVGGKGKVRVNGKEYALGFKEALYVGCGNREVSFSSDEPSQPAKFYLNSAEAYRSYPTKKITLKEAKVIRAGSGEKSNARVIDQLIVSGIVPTCQLQMGLTELQSGSVWNTMPPHTHLRRTEVYLYFNLPEGQVIEHTMGEPTETRNLWVHNEQAVIAPFWSVHCAAGTSNYMFVWGMAGENLDYSDMKVFDPQILK